MKYSATDWSFLGEQDAAAYYAGLKAIGIDGVEMVAPEHIPLAKAAGLSLVTASAPGMQEGLNRRELHGNLQPAIAAQIAAAAAEGIGKVIVFSGNRAQLSDDEAVAVIAEGLAPLLAQADSLGVDLVFEMLNARDHAGYQADSCAFGLALVERCAHPRLSLLYDVYHMAVMAEDYLQQLQRYLPQIGHIHIAGHPGRGFPGPEQDIDYPAVMRQLARSDYDGWCGLEFKPTGNALERLQAAVAQLEQALLDPA